MLRLRNRIRIGFAGRQLLGGQAGEGWAYRVIVVVPENPADILRDGLVGC